MLLSFGIVLFGAMIAWWLGNYEFAFGLMVISLANGAINAVAASLNPDWYLARRNKVFPVEIRRLVHPLQRRNLIRTLWIMVATNAIAVWCVGRLAGHF